jgi:hypothetical protein
VTLPQQIYDCNFSGRAAKKYAALSGESALHPAAKAGKTG